MTININLNDYTEFDHGYYPVIGVSKIYCDSQRLYYTPKYCFGNANRFFLESTVDGTFRLYRNDEEVFVKQVLGNKDTYIDLLPPFYEDLFEINFLASSTSLVDNTFAIIGGLQFINESGNSEHFVTTKYWVCNSSSAKVRKVNYDSGLLSSSSSDITYLSNNIYPYANWIWDDMNKHHINCILEFRTENKYINSNQTCP